MPRLGISFTGQLSYDEMIGNVTRAADFAYHSVWVAEHYFFRESMSLIASFATRFDKLVFGTGIVSPYTRHLGLLAMSAQTLSEISEGRFILGLGTNSRFWKVLGVNDKSPLKTMRKNVDQLRLLFGTGGEGLEEGKKFKMNFVTRFKIPIYLGAIGPRMLQLCADKADGVILSAGASPEYARRAVSIISSRRLVKSQNARSQDFEIACYIIACVDNDPKTRQKAKERLANLLSLPGREMLLGPYASDQRIPKIRSTLFSKGSAEAAKMIGEDMLDSVCISGTPDKCLDMVEQYRNHGVTLPILSPVGGHNFQKLMEVFT